MVRVFHHEARPLSNLFIFRAHLPYIVYWHLFYIVSSGPQLVWVWLIDLLVWLWLIDNFS